MQGFQDYDNLVTTITRWLERDDLDQRIPDFIWMTECELQNELKLRLSDKISQGRSAAGQDWIELPDDYVEMRFLRFAADTIQDVQAVSFAKLDSIRFSNEAVVGDRVSVLNRNQVPRGRTSGAHVFGNRIYLAAPPGEGDYEMFYRAGTQHLSSENKTNLLLREYPTALLYGSLMHSAPFIEDDARIATWQPLYDRAKAIARISEENAKLGTGGLRARPEGPTP